MRLAEQELAAGRVAAGVAEVDKLRVPDVVPSRRLLALLLAAGQEDRARTLASQSGAGVERLATALVDVDRRAEAIDLLRHHLDGLGREAAWEEFNLYMLLADLLVDAGRGAEALALCRSSEYWPERWVATRLARAGNLARLRAMADVGLIPAQRELAALLAERGQFAELEDRTRRGDEYAAKQLVVLGRTDLYEVASDRSRSGSK